MIFVDPLPRRRAYDGAMSHNAFVFGDLRWPMADFGLIAVWRAMSIDPSRWDDWKGFVEGVRTGAGTIGAMVDDVTGRPSASAFQLDISDTGVRLRACLDEDHADDWQRLAIAWRMAADLGASGEFAWCRAERGPKDVAYHAVISDYASRWEVLEGASTNAIEVMPGRRESAALAPKKPGAALGPKKPAAALAPKQAAMNTAKKAASKRAAKKASKRR